MASNTLKIASAIPFCVLLMICVYDQASAGPLQMEPVTQTCLGCICEAASGCNVTNTCSGDVCGPFRITWGYWVDSGKPTANNEQSNNDGAYPRCVNDHVCAARTVQGYMAKYGQDCNGDGRVNCDDYVRIHRYGGHGCTQPLDAKYDNTYRYCMQSYG